MSTQLNLKSYNALLLSLLMNLISLFRIEASDLVEASHESDVSTSASVGGVVVLFRVCLVQCFFAASQQLLRTDSVMGCLCSLGKCIAKASRRLKYHSTSPRAPRVDMPAHAPVLSLIHI